MIRNYFLVAVRNISRHSSYTIINVLGLGLGMACALLIFSLVSHHLSYERFHPDIDRAYRIVTDQQRDQMSYTGSVPAPLGKALREEYTFTEKVGRVATFGDPLITVTKNGQISKFIEPDIAMGEADFFDIFSIPMVNGVDPKALFTDPKTAIITERLAKKYYGDSDPIGQLFKVNNEHEFRVVGVMKDIPDNTDFRAEIYISYEALKHFNEWLSTDDSWGGISSNMRCYTRLKPGVSVGEMEEAMVGFVKKYRPTSKNIHHYKLQPLTDMHFNPRYGGSMNMRNIIALSVIGLLLVVTACVNFVNLATARATSRSREVGVRKVLGGVRSQILRQFMSETFVITLVSIVVAAGVAMFVIPVFNEWFNSRLSVNIFADWKFLVFMPALLLFVTSIAGFYPGVVLSGFQAAAALKGKVTQGGAKMNLRRTLIVGQFAISQLLVIVLIVVMNQVEYAQTTDLGFDRDAVLMVTTGSWDEKAKTLKSRLEQVPGVEGVSQCWAAPSSNSHWGTSVRYGNNAEVENFQISAKLADHDFISVFGIDLVAGRNITQNDSLREFLVNEKFAQNMGMKPEDLIGQMIAVNGEWRYPIVGVVKDFHDASLHEDIKPIFIGVNMENYNNYAVKLDPKNISATMKEIETMWSETYPDQIYSSVFVDEEIADFYRSEENMLKLVELFSVVAIVVGCLGLFGLVSFMAMQRTKEIGIRKVLGSSVTQILWIFGKEFSILIVVAFMIAAPAGWTLMDNWLMDYQYHIPLESWMFLSALGFTVVISMITVGYRSMRAASANPVDSLRSE